MPFAPRRVALPLLALLFVAAGYARAEDVAEPEKFVRFTEDRRAGGRLETAVVTYRNADGVEVKLVSAIHIGETSYFQDLNKRFEADDAVLYELVKDKDAELPAPGAAKREAAEGGGGHPIADLQRFLKDTLKLDYQLDVVDYTKPNFVHADLDRETFERMQAERGETFEMMMLKQLMAAMRDPGAAAPALPVGDDPEQALKELVRVIARPDSERQIKTFIAKQMDQMEDVAMGLDGPGGSVILTERNKAAVKVLEETIAKGKRKVSVFYGAAHMPDLAKRLREMKFTPAAVEWKQAWDLTIRADQPSAIEQVLIDAIDALTEPELPEGGDGAAW